MSELIVSEKHEILNPNKLTFEERKKQIELEEKMEEESKKREKNSTYSKWYQFNLEHNKEMIWLAKNAPRAHIILLFLIEQMDGYNAVMTSYQVLCEALDIGRTTASQSVKILRDKGFISILKSGTSNVYVVNDDLAWKSWGKNRKYCKFPANIILSISENPDYNTELESKNIKQIDIKN